MESLGPSNWPSVIFMFAQNSIFYRYNLLVPRNPVERDLTVHQNVLMRSLIERYQYNNIQNDNIQQNNFRQLFDKHFRTNLWST